MVRQYEPSKPFKPTFPQFGLMPHDFCLSCKHGPTQVVPNWLQVGVESEQSAKQCDSIKLWYKTLTEKIALKHADNALSKWFWLRGSQRIDGINVNKKVSVWWWNRIIIISERFVWVLGPLEIHFHLFIEFLLPCLEHSRDWKAWQSDPIRTFEHHEPCSGGSTKHWKISNETKSLRIFWAIRIILSPQCHKCSSTPLQENEEKNDFVATTNRKDSE